MSTVLRFDSVWKSYPAHERRERTLRGMLAGDVPLLRRGSVRWALRDVGLELAAGRSLGIVGHNGAGKSTLLRLLSGLGRPTRGSVRVDPDVASVLNLGAAFDLESSGRENAYTAALVAGHARGAARRIVPAALRFAELEEFADAPVRTYSDGMRLRLAFGVIAESRPRLLALDEVLAVGDLAFRRKCEDRIAELRAGGTSVVLVSHALEDVRATCDEAVWLHRGAVRATGETGAVLEAYRDAMLARTRERTPVGAGRDDQGLELGVDRFGSQELRVAGVAVDGSEGPAVVAAGAPVRIAVRVEAAGPPVEDPIVCVALRRRADSAVVLDLSTRAAGVSLGPAVGVAEIDLVVERLELSAGEYALDVGVFERDWEHAYDFHSSAYPLRVEGRVAGSGVLMPPHRWVRER